MNFRHYSLFSKFIIPAGFSICEWYIFRVKVLTCPGPENDIGTNPEYDKHGKDSRKPWELGFLIQLYPVMD